MALTEARAIPKGVSAGRLLVVVAAFVSLVFALGIGLIASDQQKVLADASRMNEQTLPRMLRSQHLARNLERLHEEGENILASNSPEGRQQALFMVKLIAAHPSIVDDPRARAVAGQAQKLLQDVVEQARADGAVPARHREAWRLVSRQLVLVIDEVFSESVTLAADDLGRVSASMLAARAKLFFILPAFIALLLLVLWQVQRLLVRPLHRIDQALARLDTDTSPPQLAPSPLREITAAQVAIGELSELLAQKEESRVALEELASLDDLTGLLNRRKFMEMAQVEVLRDQRHRRPVVVAMADIDQFKAINDTHGHAAGDEVLKAFAKVLRENLRETDLVGRIGGEEFAFVLPEVTAEIAVRLMDRVRSQFAQQAIDLGDCRYIRATLSVGICDTRDVPLDTALRRADAALYEAKSRGRNRVEVAPLASA